MRNKLTDRMLCILDRAKEIATKWNHNYVGSEHVLVAMSEIDSVAKFILDNLREDSKEEKSVDALVKEVLGFE